MEKVNDSLSMLEGEVVIHYYINNWFAEFTDTPNCLALCTIYGIPEVETLANQGSFEIETYIRRNYKIVFPNFVLMSNSNGLRNTLIETDFIFIDSDEAGNGMMIVAPISARTQNNEEEMFAELKTYNPNKPTFYC